MNIIHYSNSFVSIKENDTLIACDPWTGYGQENGWLSYPIYKNGAFHILYVVHLLETEI